MYKYQIAPMMGWTDRHFRYLMRLLGGDAYLLFSEMVTVNALVYGDAHRYLDKSPIEGDVILQIGGSDENMVAHAIQKANSYDYAGYNLNVGCPSDRVQKGRIGACLMAEGPLVAKLLQVMQDNTDKPVSIKTRVGIDGVDCYDYLKSFVDQVLESGCHEWIIHARDAWLKGLSPRQNRSIPPLRYEYVYQLKQEYPHLHITLNGGLKTQPQIEEALQTVDAVMLGRAAYQDPRLIHALGTSMMGYEECLHMYIKYIYENIDAYPIRELVAPLVIAMHAYRGAKHDRARLAACRTKEEVLSVLAQLNLLNQEEVSV